MMHRRTTWGSKDDSAIVSRLVAKFTDLIRMQFQPIAPHPIRLIHGNQMNLTTHHLPTMLPPKPHPSHPSFRKETDRESSASPTGPVLSQPLLLIARGLHRALKDTPPESFGGAHLLQLQEAWLIKSGHVGPDRIVYIEPLSGDIKTLCRSLFLFQNDEDVCPIHEHSNGFQPRNRNSPILPNTPQYSPILPNTPQYSLGISFDFGP